MRGKRWRIGNGESTQILLAPWVPGCDILTYLNSLNGNELGEERVSSLLDHTSNFWDINKVRNMFNTRVATKILKINLGHQPRPQ